MNEQNKNFILKTGVITLSVIIILFFTNLWIIKPVSDFYKSKEHSKTEKFIQKTWREKENININWKDAAKYVGKYVITEGKIVSSFNNGMVCFLNFDKDYKNSLSLVIFPSSFKKFPENPEKFYLGKKVRVEGRIKIYNDRLEIILDSQDQIKVLDF